ncbi:hypothetical protein [Streptomyces regalis]|uniref:Guanylate cyclase domain-containing protein n=1 Tax=Streptomyces regalis TaxID=68262 RepID=A0A0X3VHA8_9ACTN|nr:hypothetical protein [Streptomyces regalis]KUL43994.1 hypothetical protein ADL12_06325 [Streptomyces regalis]
MNHDALELTEAHYELVISVDARRSGGYDDVDKTRMRARIYRVVETAFSHAKVARDAVHMEDRGDGVLLSVPGRIAVSRLLGLWLIEVHEKLRDENRDLAVPLGLRIGMHVGPVRHDERGISGRAVDLACRLADSPVARQLLDAEKADLVLVTSQSLYEDVVSGGGKFIEPAHYSSARLELKEGEVTAWFHLPGRPAPAIPVTPSAFTEAVAEAADITADFAGIRPRSRFTAGPDQQPASSGFDDESGDDEFDDNDEFEVVGDKMAGHRPARLRIHYDVTGDMSQNHHNEYQGDVHIGRKTDGGTEKGRG